MKKIKRAKSIPDLLEIASEQCLKRNCRICIAFNNLEQIQRIVDDGLTSELPYYAKYDSRRIEIRFDKGAYGYSQIDIISFDISYARGRRYNYVLIDSSLSDEAKCIIKAMTVRNHWLMTNKKIRYKRDKRKNIIQEFTLAEEWPLLSNTK